ncbi:MAG: helix-turn-helix domain-containing protein [Treponemataceae bacterium]
MENLKKIIGNRLKIVRTSYFKLNQTEFAAQLGIKQGALSKYETGESSLPDDIKIFLIEKGISSHWLLTGEGEPFLDEKKEEKTNPIYTFDDSDFSPPLFEVPLLTKEDALKYNPKKEIPEPQAHTGKYPNKILILAPYWLKEFSTDLRAITVFNSRMAPILNAGDVALFEGTGYMGDGIYVYRLENNVHIGRIHWENSLFIIWTDFKPDEKIETDDIDLLGRIRATVKRVL